MSTEFSEFQRKSAADEISVGIDRPFARQFFVTLDKDTLRYATGGEPIYLELLVVRGLFYLPYLILAATLIISIPVLKWFSIGAIPLLFFLNLLLFGTASLGGQKSTSLIIAIIACIVLAGLFREAGVLVILFIASLPLPYILYRLMYGAASRFLRLLVHRNEHVYNFLNEHGQLWIVED